MVHSNKKGSTGEREFCKWLADNLGITVKRELGQAREGGADVLTENFIFEVKRREVLDLNSWWYQVVIAQKKHPEKIAVVAYRQNRKRWRFLIPAKLIGVNIGHLEVGESVFLTFAKAIEQGRSLSELV